MKLRRPSTSRPRGAWWWVPLAILLAAASASAQVIQLQGGSSSLLDATGGSLELHGGNSTARLDLGFMNSPEIGFSYSRPYAGWDWTVGDQMIPFVLPTDLFNRSYYFMGRGLSLERRSDRSRILFYAGTTSLGLRTPFLNVARSQKPMELVFIEDQISPTQRFYSYNLLSSHQTSLQGFDWTPRRGLRLATTAGVGADQPYWAGSLEYQHDWVKVQTSYTRAGDSFRRVDVQAPLVAETAGANLRVELTPIRWLAVTLSHQNYLNPDPTSPAGPTAGVDSVGASVVAAGFRFNGSAFRSQTNVNHLHSFMVGAQRNFGGRASAELSYFESSAAHARWRSLSTLLREDLTRRFSLSQVITHSNGATTLGLGGNFVSNFFSIGLEHQTFFFPFTQAGRSPLRQALLINLSLHLPHNIAFHGSTSVDALGHLRYTTYADSYFYPRGGGRNGGGFRRIPTYVVRGIVVDEHQHPIRGAALEIDGQHVFTDSRGLFSLRVEKRKNYSLKILPGQFMFPGRYAVVSAPASVKGGTEAMAKLYQIILKRIFSQPPALSATGPKPAQSAFDRH